MSDNNWRDMNPADRLIVALDVPVEDAFDLVQRLRYQVNNFKIGVGTFISPGGFAVSHFIVERGCGLLVDLKLYDTRDTVKRTMEIVAKLGAAMVTVHADCMEHAVGFGPKVLAVFSLTDGTGRSGLIPIQIKEFDRAEGVVCPAWRARYLRVNTKKLIVCPGVRPAGTSSDNHLRPATPRETINAGADYIVVGRPIYAAVDPAESARSITREIETALTARPIGSANEVNPFVGTP